MRGGEKRRGEEPPGEVFTACVKSAWGSLRIGRPVLVVSAEWTGCGGGERLYINSCWLQWTPVGQRDACSATPTDFERIEPRTEEDFAYFSLLATPWFPGDFYAPTESEENAAEMSGAWFNVLQKDPISWYRDRRGQNKAAHVIFPKKIAKVERLRKGWWRDY